MFLTALWDRVVLPTTRSLAVVSAVLCGGLALLVTAEVLLRSATGGSIRGIFEIGELGLVLVAFLGLGRAETTGEHVRVTLLTDRLSERTANRLRAVAVLVACAFCGWMGWELIERAIESFTSGEFRTGLLNFPMWPSRAFVALGVAILAIVLLVKSLILFTGRTPTQPASSTQEAADV